VRLITRWVDIQSPANVVPNSPTASSAQIRKNIITMVIISISLFLEFSTFWSMIPINRPVIVSKAPIIIKSKIEKKEVKSKKNS